MAGPWTRGLIFIVLFAFLAGGSPAVAAEDPFEGKSLDDIRKLLEGRMEGRKKDQKFFSDYTSFCKKKQSSVERKGKSLAAAARIAGEFLQAEFLFRYGQHLKSIEYLRICDKKARKSRRQNRWLIVSAYLLSAANWAYLGKNGDMSGDFRKAEKEGAIGPSGKTVKKILLEFPTRKSELEALRKKRDLSPRGGATEGDNQWMVCDHYRTKIFMPVDEFVELSWMIEAFPKHPKVKAGEADWALVLAAEKLLDYRTTEKLCEKFRKEYPTHWAATQGDLLWVLAKAQYGKGSLKDATKTAETLKRKHPKFREVEVGRVKQLIGECKDSTPAKDRFAQGDPYNRWYDK